MPKQATMTSPSFDQQPSFPCMPWQQYPQPTDCQSSRDQRQLNAVEFHAPKRKPRAQFGHRSCGRNVSRRPRPAARRAPVRLSIGMCHAPAIEHCGVPAPSRCQMPLSAVANTEGFQPCQNIRRRPTYMLAAELKFSTVDSLAAQ